ncbi:MAG TPA: hypothetical protein VGL49_06240 [Acidimicrobiales bacterium]|jgi:hypothetical protein
MSFTDYLINGLLIALVVVQIRGRRLTVRSLVLPLILVGYAATHYLHSIPTAGNDMLLIVAGAAVGLTLGVLCAWCTALHVTEDGGVVAKAGRAAAALWIVGVGSRLAFQLYATHGGGAAIARFSEQHALTVPAAWTAALILMAIAEVLGRTGVLALRAHATGANISRHGGGRPRPVQPGRRASIMDS